MGIQNAKSKPAQVTPKPLSAEEVTKINTYLPFEANASAFAPAQEKGTRLACALPYQLAVDGALTAERNAIKLNFSAQKSLSGAAFNVYTKSKFKNEAGKTWAFGVKAGAELEAEWVISDFKDEIYSLCVDGPNGFFRSFDGSKSDLEVNISCAYEQSGLLRKLTGNLQLIIENHEDKAIEISIKDDPYRANNKVIKVQAKSRKIVTLNLLKSKGWYDFKISISGLKDFEQQYAGHVETGEDSISDPLMGGLIG